MPVVDAVKCSRKYQADSHQNDSRVSEKDEQVGKFLAE